MKNQQESYGRRLKREQAEREKQILLRRLERSAVSDKNIRELRQVSARYERHLPPPVLGEEFNIY